MERNQLTRILRPSGPREATVAAKSLEPSVSTQVLSVCLFYLLLYRSFPVPVVLIHLLLLQNVPSASSLPEWSNHAQVGVGTCVFVGSNEP